MNDRFRTFWFGCLGFVSMLLPHTAMSEELPQQQFFLPVS